mgnify:CR=1 FL=1
MTYPYPWQRTQWAQIERCIWKSQWPHGLLLAGPPDTGKIQFAVSMTQWLLCTNSNKHDGPCDECRSCKLFLAHTHPDFFEVSPPEPGKQLGIESIRDLIRNLSLTAFSGPYKVAHIISADRMTIPAANALLKTLEEPPGNTILLLIADRLGGLPKTVISRCQRIAFPVPNAATVRPWLSKKITDTDLVDRYLGVATGRPLLALRYAQSPESCHRNSVFLPFFSLLSGQTVSSMEVANKWRKLGFEEVCGWLITFLSDVIRLKSTGCLNFLANSDLEEPMKALASRLDLHSLFRLMDLVNDTRINHSSRVGLNDQLGLEALAIEVKEAGKTARTQQG